MTAITRIRDTATPLYPGSFMPEEGRPVLIADADPATALAAVPDDGRWFALSVCTVTERRWDDGAGGSKWLAEGAPDRYRIYVGETFTADEIEAWSNADSYRILLSNMRGNGWERVVRTRAGNFQPVESVDVVVSRP